jgi:hypothetical protein
MAAHSWIVEDRLAKIGKRRNAAKSSSDYIPTEMSD